MRLDWRELEMKNIHREEKIRCEMWRCSSRSRESAKPAFQSDFLQILYLVESNINLLEQVGYIFCS